MLPYDASAKSETGSPAADAILQDVERIRTTYPAYGRRRIYHALKREALHACITDKACFDPEEAERTNRNLDRITEYRVRLCLVYLRQY